MATVKTAVSLEKSLFEQVDGLAEQLHMPRSQVFALALEEFIERHQNRRMLRELDEVYADVSDRDEETLREQMRRRHRELLEGQW